jgi:LysM repeat protein
MKMTRENKLALVVGFGLVLFVGILISDHFSTARNQESADIRTGRLVDPLAQNRHDNATLIELPGTRPVDDAVGPRRPGPLAMHTGQLPGEEPEPRVESPERRTDAVPPRNEIPRIVMGGNHSTIEGFHFVEQEESINFIFHHVQQGESLIAIARRYYGDESMVKDLARLNEIENPNTIRVGHRLRIPAIEALRGGDSPRQVATRTTQSRETPAASENRAPVVYTSYTVKRGDTLSEISQQLLGTARRWREIYEMNRDVIRDPDNLLAGTELKIPRPGR